MKALTPAKRIKRANSIVTRILVYGALTLIVISALLFATPIGEVIVNGLKAAFIS